MKKASNPIRFNLVEVTDPKLAKEILRHNGADTYDFKTYLESLETVSGRNFNPLMNFCQGSLVYQRGKEHLKNRRVLKTFTGSKNVKSWEPQIKEALNEITANISSKKSFDLVQDLANPLYLFLARIVFGIEVPKEQESQFVKEIALAKDLVEPYVSIRKLDQIQQAIEKIKQHVSKATSQNKPHENSLLGQLADHQDEHKDYLVVSMLVGVHTTAETLCLILLNLLSSREGIVFYKNCKDKNWLNKRIDGLLRLYPTTQSIFRYATKDFMLDDITYPQGTLFQLNLKSINRSAPFYSEKQILQGDLEPKCPFNHTSFGGGAHKCPGNELAKSTITMALSIFSEKLPNITLNFENLSLRHTIIKTEPIEITVGQNRVGA
ncbi:cytochrome P450 [Leeuwenhoekiella aestuarii]|uniref:Cytochrome P450 n=1 Tax=Leeuwenhoekiella aestuarii TaxID=2249426 RepID=A0A4Q0NRS5_9FLAO|nr:cytochrome P450 [Leeuwenhoekiella aestuarii]RXG13114.1 cytochrome P450 [Leeuwenhoekiella aestuarii]